MTARAVTAEYTDNGSGTADLATLLTAAATVEDFRNDGSMVFIVKNASGSPITVTVKAQPDPYGRGGATVNDVVYTVADAKICVIPFMNPAMFNAGGLAQITISAVTTVTAGLFRLSKVR